VTVEDPVMIASLSESLSASACRPAEASDEELFMSWTQIEQRMAWYASLYKHRRFRVSRLMALEWRVKLQEAIQIEYARISQGLLPRRLTPFVVLGEGPGGDDGADANPAS
jgi:hypothetical protein